MKEEEEVVVEVEEDKRESVCACVTVYNVKSSHSWTIRHILLDVIICCYESDIL